MPFISKYMQTNWSSKKVGHNYDTFTVRRFCGTSENHGCETATLFLQQIQISKNCPILKTNPVLFMLGKINAFYLLNLDLCVFFKSVQPFFMTLYKIEILFDVSIGIRIISEKELLKLQK